MPDQSKAVPTTSRHAAGSHAAVISSNNVCLPCKSMIQQQATLISASPLLPAAAAVGTAVLGRFAKSSLTMISVWLLGATCLIKTN